jgi:hypothetical protein
MSHGSRLARRAVESASQKLQNSVITQCGQVMKARNDKACSCDLTDVILHHRVGAQACPHQFHSMPADTSLLRVVINN